MPVPILVLHGTTLHGTHVGEREAFCGRCLRPTPHALIALEERSHIYFVSYGPVADAGRITVCRQCGVSVPIFDREPEGEAEAMVDAFLDAHHRPFEVAMMSPGIAASAVGIAAAALALVIAGAWILPDFWALGACFVIVPLAFYAWSKVRFRMAIRSFGRDAAPRLTELRRLTRWTHEQVLDRADARGYLRLRDYLVATWPDAD